MQIKQERPTPTSLKLTVQADQKSLDSIKKTVLARLGSELKVSGFRAGKAPSNIVEKQLDPALFQSEFLNDAINALYSQAVRENKLRPVKEPEVSITKYVPFTTLEFTANMAVVGDLKLADYKIIKMSPTKPSITTNEINEVIENILERSAEKKEVKRAAKNGDEVNLDFKGIDAKTKEPIEGADGSDYPLALGSNAFIPGFEEEIIGLKPGAKKAFDIRFPKEYNVADLQNKLVNFSVTINSVKELIKPKLDDKFVENVGPFKTVAELKQDIKKQLTTEKENEANQKFSNDLLQAIADKSDVAIPDSLIEDEIDRLEDEEKRNVAYRGQTWQEHLDSEGVTAEEHKKKQRPLAETRIKTGLILGEVSDLENITVSADELEAQLSLLKGQYKDPAMLAELDKPENQRDIYSRLLIEKTIERLKQLATVKPDVKK
jgi:trigger factor